MAEGMASLLPGERVQARVRIWSLNKMHHGAFVFIEAQECLAGTMLTLCCRSPAVANLEAMLAGEPPALGPGAVVMARGVVEAPRERKMPAKRPSTLPQLGAEEEGGSDGEGSAHIPASRSGKRALYASESQVGRWRREAFVRLERRGASQPRPSVACHELEVLFPAGAAVPRELLPPVPCIAFDLDYFGAMNALEVKALARQLLACYTSARQQARPPHLLACGLPAPAPLAAARAEKITAGDSSGEGLRGAELLSSELGNFSWAQWAVQTSEAPPWELFPAADCVYLTSEAAEELRTVERGKAYILGGLVDHKEKRAFSLQHAQAHGIATARLPLARYVKMHKPALSTSAVVQILMLYHELGDWGEAIRTCPAMHVAPLRKYALWLKPEGGRDAAEGADGSASDDLSQGSDSTVEGEVF